ncbi:MAG: hypothetical protein AABY46_01050 [Nitrospirota bacterium]
MARVGAEQPYRIDLFKPSPQQVAAHIEGVNRFKERVAAQAPVGGSKAQELRVQIAECEESIQRGFAMVDALDKNVPVPDEWIDRFVEVHREHLDCVWQLNRIKAGGIDLDPDTALFAEIESTGAIALEAWMAHWAEAVSRMDSAEYKSRAFRLLEEAVRRSPRTGQGDGANPEPDYPCPECGGVEWAAFRALDQDGLDYSCSKCRWEPNCQVPF